MQGSSFKIDNIYFATNSYEINQISEQVINEFISYLRVNKSIVIEINGYTDNVGSLIIKFCQKIEQGRFMNI